MLPLIGIPCKHWLICCPRENGITLQHSFIVKKGQTRGSKLHFGLHFSDGVNSNSGLDVKPSREVENIVLEKLQKQITILKERRETRTLNFKTAENFLNTAASKWDLDEAYARCGEVSAEFSKSFHWGALLMPPDQRRAIWAINAWVRRVDDLVDGQTGPLITADGLNEWINRLVDVYQRRPHDIFDAALSDTVSKYPIDIQLFEDMIEGMSWDLGKLRYQNFDELYLYSYHVAGTIALMTLTVIGIAPKSQIPIENVVNAALALGIANQLTNILRDVGEDSRRGRIYLPQDELARAGLSDDDILRGKVTEKWRNFMRGQIKRARMFFDEAEKGIAGLDSSCRWPVWVALLLYRNILDAIEANDYNNFERRVFVTRVKKSVILSVAYAKALLRRRPW